jgi:GT2 family glycosyltransferase
MKNILIIPFYQNEQYIDNFVKYFSSHQSECDLFEKICIFNDCPDSPGSTYLQEQCALAKFEYIPNEINLGFLKTANRGFAIAKDFGANLVLLNSDTLPHKNAFYELLKCFETDSMIGCVAPRSNNATICNLFSAPFYIESDADLKKIVEVFEESKNYVPQISYAPVTNGFCIAIRCNVIKSFPDYSEEFNPGYEEENDYCLRVSSHGFRIAIANYAFIGHLEGRSFGLNHGRNELKEKNHFLLLQKYSFYNNLLTMHAREYSTKAYASIIAALSRGVNKILVDASNLGPYYNGTNKLIVECVHALASCDYEVDLVVSEEAFSFHGLSEFRGVSRLSAGVQGNYFYGFRIGQPFNHGALVFVPSSAIYGINIFFDSIAIDCPQLYEDHPEIYGIWSICQRLFSHISFISDHSHKQFVLRFGGVIENLYTNLLPRSIESKEIEPMPYLDEKKYALVVGNKFTHKGLEIALKELPRIAGLEYLVISGELNGHNRSDFKFLAAGELSEERMHELYFNCECVIFPSFAEGFGYPVLEALSYGKRIFLRDIDCYREIASGLDVNLINLVSFVDTFSKISISDFSNNKIQSFNRETYEEYVSNIFGDIEKKSPEDFFNNLVLKIQLLELIHLQEDPKKSLLRYIKHKYNSLVKIRVLREPLIFARNLLYKYK